MRSLLITVLSLAFSAGAASAGESADKGASVELPTRRGLLVPSSMDYNRSESVEKWEIEKLARDIIAARKALAVEFRRSSEREEHPEKGESFQFEVPEAEGYQILVDAAAERIRILQQAETVVRGLDMNGDDVISGREWNFLIPVAAAAGKAMVPLDRNCNGVVEVFEVEAAMPKGAAVPELPSRRDFFAEKSGQEGGDKIPVRPVPPLLKHVDRDSNGSLDNAERVSLIMLMIETQTDLKKDALIYDIVAASLRSQWAKERGE